MEDSRASGMVRMDSSMIQRRKRERDRNFTPAEVKLMIDMYEANKEVLNSRIFTNVENEKKYRVYQRMVDELNKMIDRGKCASSATSCAPICFFRRLEDLSLSLSLSLSLYVSINIRPWVWQSHLSKDSRFKVAVDILGMHRCVRYSDLHLVILKLMGLPQYQRWEGGGWRGRRRRPMIPVLLVLDHLQCQTTKILSLWHTKNKINS